MLPYALAIAVGLSSLVLFSTAFIMSDIHRKDDFFWSGIGLFYALVLWFCANRLTGSILLGQTAATALVVSYNWQTIKLRKAIVNPEAADKLNQFSILSLFGNVLSRQKTPAKVATTETATITDKEITIPRKASKKTEEVTKNKETPKPKKSLLNKFRGGNKQQSPPEQETAKIEDILENATVIDTQTIPEPVKKTVAKSPKVPESISETPSALEKATETKPEKTEIPESRVVSTSPIEEDQYIPPSKIVDIIDVKVENAPENITGEARDSKQTNPAAPVTPTSSVNEDSPVAEESPAGSDIGDFIEEIERKQHEKTDKEEK